MSLLAVTVGAGPSAVVDALRSVGWYGVNVCRRLACSDGCYNAFSSVAPVGTVGACCDACGLRLVVGVSLCAQPGMVGRDVSECVEEGGTCLCLRAARSCFLFCLWFLARCGRAFWCRLVGGVSLLWRLARAVAGVGVWRLPRWRLASCCVAAAREWCYAGSACELV